MPSIGVLEHFQKPTDKPTRRIKRSGGQSLVRQGKAEWIRENVLLIMRPASAHKPLQIHDEMPMIKTYIPDKMPANIDARLGIIAQVPALTNQVRFRAF